VVLTQVGDEASKILRTRGKVTLEDLAERLREAGLEAKVAGPMSLNLMSPDTMKQFRSIGLGPELTRAMAKPGKMTGPVRLASSLAVFEVLEVIKPIGPKELAQAAKIEYERQVGEKAFNLWLDNLRSEATIEINPNLLASIDDENLSDMLKPKVPWKSLTPWDETLPGGPRPTGPDGLDGTLGPDGGGEVVTSPDAVDFSGPWPTFKSDNQPHMPLPQEEASGPTAGDPVTGLTTGNPAAGDQSDGRIPGGPSAIDQSDGPVSVATED
jgi:hypothetical protein